MDETDKTLSVFAIVVAIIILGCTTLGVINSMDAHKHRAPDMSKCELMTSSDGHNAWYSCPYSMGV